jgi:thioesterase superfamily protein
MIDTTALPPSSLHEKLGIEITRASAAEVVGSMPVTGNTQPAGLLHGGATAALIEGLASLAAWLHAHPERVAVGVDLNVTHLRPVTSGRITGRAVPVHLGNGTVVHTVDVHDDEGRLTATGRLTSQLVAPKK